jgi:hypothetical protein
MLVPDTPAEAFDLWLGNTCVRRLAAERAAAAGHCFATVSPTCTYLSVRRLVVAKPVGV